MKKIITILLVVAMAFVFISCKTLPQDSSSVLSSHIITPELETERSEPSSKEESIIVDEVVFDTSSEDPPPASEPTVSKNEMANSAPTPTTNSSDAGSSPSTDYTAPSDAVLDYCGMMLEEHQAAVEEASTCPLCGRSTKLCHLYGRDMDCYDCGKPCKANTCHVCEEE